MELHIKERLIIPSILPKQNNFMGYNLKKSITNKVSISESDRNEYGIKEEGEGNIVWDGKKDKELPLVVEFSKDEIEYMRKACESISEQEMSDDIWDVVQRIYDNGQE